MQFDLGYTSQTSSMPPMWMIGTSQKWVLRKWWRCFASDILRRHSKKQTDWQCRCKERAMRSYWEHGNRKVILQLQHFRRIILQLQHLRGVILLQHLLPLWSIMYLCVGFFQVAASRLPAAPLATRSHALSGGKCTVCPCWRESWSSYCQLSHSIVRMMKLELLGRKILAVFLAMVYLAQKTSTILNLMSAACDGILQVCCEKTKSIDVLSMCCVKYLTCSMVS